MPRYDAESVLEFQVLGGVRVLDEGTPLAIGGPKQRSVLAVLLAQLDTRVTTDAIADAIYGEAKPDAPRRVVQTYVSNLRKVVGDAIRHEPDGYRLAAPRRRVDATHFEDLVKSCRTKLDHAPAEAAAGLRRALAMWRGHPYADVDGGLSLTVEATRLNEMRMAALETRIEADLSLGHHEQLIPELEALTFEHPYAEKLRGLHMLALYRSGRQTDALRAYEKTRHGLLELGIEPSPELEELNLRVLEHDERIAAPTGPAVRQIVVLVVEVYMNFMVAEVPADQRVEMVSATDRAVSDAINESVGRVFAQRLSTSFASFDNLAAALEVADAIVRRAPRAGSDSGVPAVRVALDLGDAHLSDGDSYEGPVVMRAAGLLSLTQPGQILLSADVQSSAAELAGFTVRSLGAHAIPHVEKPEALYQLVQRGLPSDFAAPQSPADAVPRIGGIRHMPGFELRDRVGRAGGWVTWRAYQPSVGRGVAVHVLAPEFSSRPDFVRRFELEALTVARLEHPHIVPLFDYWRDLTGAYLVQPWITGKTLAARTEGELLSLEHGSQLLGEIGGALEAAHHAGVAHGEVSSRTILADERGGFLLTGFGVGRRTGEGPPTAAADATGLAQTLAASVTMPGEGRERLTNAPFGSIAEVIELWRSVHGAELPPSERFTELRNPYRGLDAFTYADAANFFGRDGAVSAVVARLADHRFTAVVGPSGVGKSSLVQAGLLPALVDGAIEGSTAWFLPSMTPGAAPFEALERELQHLATAPLPAVPLAEAAASGQLAEAVDATLPEGAHALLVIDQFEELFTLVEPNLRERFLEGVGQLVTHPNGTVRVLITLRADFFDRPLEHPGFGELLRSGTVPISAPTDEELRQAIEKPACRVCVEFEPGLVDRILSDVGTEPGRLPLLEYALTELFERRVSDVMRLADYEAAGGVLGALGRRAESIYAQFDQEGQAAARQTFLRLVTLPAPGHVARRRVRMSDLAPLAGESDVTVDVVSAYAEHRLLTMDRDPVAHGPTVEVAHEAIFARWERLAEWIDSRQDDLAARRRLIEVQEEWENSERSEEMLLSGARLVRHETWVNNTDLSLSTGEKAFLAASMARRDRLAVERRRRRRSVLAGFGAAAVLALVLASVAWIQRGEAQTEASLAEARELILEAEKNLAVDPELAVMLAIEAMEAFDRAGDQVPGSVVDVLRKGINTNPIRARIPGGQVATVSADGSTLATLDKDKNIALWDTETFSFRETLRVDGEILDAWYAEQLDELYVAVYSNRQLRAWHSSTREWETLPGDPSGLSSVDQGVRVEVTPDGRTIVGYGIDSVVAWDRSSGATKYAVASPGNGGLAVSQRAVAFGSTLDTGSPGVRIIDVETGSQLQVLGALSLDPTYLSFSPDGDSLAVASDDGGAAVIDLATGSETWTRSDLDRTRQPLWIHGGTAIAIGGEDRLAVFDAASGDILRDSIGANSGSTSYDEIPGKNLVVAASVTVADEVVAIDTSQTVAGELGLLQSPVLQPFRLLIDEGGDRLFLRGIREGFAVVDVDQGAVIVDGDDAPIDPDMAWGFAVASHNGRFVGGADADGTYRIWTVPGGQVVYEAPPGWSIVGINDDGTTVVINRPGSQPRLVDMREPSTWSSLPAGDTHRAVFTSDGRRVVTNNNGDAEPFVRIFDAVAGTYLGGFGSDAGVQTGWWHELTADGTRLVVGGYSGVLRVIDLDLLVAGATPEQAVVSQISAHDTFTLMVQLSPDETMIASTSWDEPVKLWDIRSGRFLGEFGSGAATAMAFHPTEPWLYVAEGDVVTIHTLDIEELKDIAHSRLTRAMVEEECERYLRRECKGAAN